MSAERQVRLQRRDDWEPGPSQVAVGVDIVELVSSAMYTDPLAMYREYVQNSADSIDDARDSGLPAGRIDFQIDSTTRSVTIRDDGAGLSRQSFLRMLTAFGGSEKRAVQRRGFRGVGRLAGLGYCQELIFRSQAAGETTISELRWDSRLLRSLLRAADFSGDLAGAVAVATSHRKHQASQSAHFFEVELRGVVRHGRDDLLNEQMVREYLSEVAPVAFSPSFDYGEEIRCFLGARGTGSSLDIFVNGDGPITRPHGNRIPVKGDLASSVTGPEFFEITGVDGALAACGWLLHHEYLGAIPQHARVRGLRLRSGDLQIGAEDVLAELFAEPRFNSWAIGEIHVLDRRIYPNGRRDYFEHSVHFANVRNHLAPRARAVVARCRASSQSRQQWRRATLFAERLDGHLAVIEQGALTKTARAVYVAESRDLLRKMEKLANTSLLSAAERAKVRRRLARSASRLARIADYGATASPLQQFAPQRRKAYEEILSLLYSCATDSRAARDLVERVLNRLA